MLSNQQLWASIESFEFDQGKVAYPFAARLSDETGWSRAYALAAIREYRRFVYLALTGDQPVTPSREVDAVWHLHLTYTRSYWERFCGETLGRPLHHEPTPGGNAAATTYRAQYANTKARYLAEFGENAPVALWPPENERFQPDIRK